MACAIQQASHRLLEAGRTTTIEWVKGHSGIPGNERADLLAGKAAEKHGWSATASIAYLKLQISEKYRSAKERWSADPANHSAREIPPLPPKKSCMDRARNAIARVAAQIRTYHWRSAVYLKSIRERQDDKCWFCRRNRTVGSHVLLHVEVMSHYMVSMNILHCRDDVCV